MVEHYIDTVGVTGSNPVSRTILRPPSPLPLPLLFPAKAAVADFLRSPGELLDAVRCGGSGYIEEEARRVATLQPRLKTMSLGPVAEWMMHMERDLEAAAAVAAGTRKPRTGAAGPSTP